MASDNELLQEILRALRGGGSPTSSSATSGTPSGGEAGELVAKDMEGARRDAEAARQKELDQLKKKQDALKLTNELTNSQLGPLNKIASMRKQEREALEEELYTLKKIAKQEAEILGTITTETEEKLKQAQANKQAFEYQEKGLGKLKEAAKGLANAFNSIIPLNKLISPQFYLDTAHALDAAEASVVKNTNATREYASGVARLQAGYNGINNSAQEAATILSSLYTGYNKFNLTTDATREAMNRTATVFSKLGYSTEAYAKNTSEIGSVMHKSAEEASDFQKKLGKAGFGLNMTIGEINTKFTQTMDRFTIFGKRMGEQFLDMQTFAKNAGMELEKVMDMTDKLSTFEGAADIAGNINALLNKNILDPNTLIALSEDPIKQLQYLQKQLKDNVKLESMGVNMQRALNKAVGGLAGGADIRKLMNASPEDLKRMTGMVSASGAMGDEGLEGRAREAMTAGEKGKNGVDAMGSAAINAAGGIQKMHAAADAFAKGVSNSGSMLTGTLGSMGTVFLNLKSLFSSFGGWISKLLGLGGKAGSTIAGGAEIAGDAAKALGWAGKLGKFALEGAKWLPVVGGIVSAGDAIYRYAKGDKTGAAIEAASAGASFFAGGAGRAAVKGGLKLASVALSGTNLARDFTGASASAPQPADDLEIGPNGELKTSGPGGLKGRDSGVVVSNGQQSYSLAKGDMGKIVKGGESQGVFNSDRAISLLQDIANRLNNGISTTVENMEPMKFSMA